MHTIQKPKISILSHNLSHNCLGRAYILAKALSTQYDVEIIGPMNGNDIWGPVRGDTSIVYKKFSRIPNPIAFVRAISGDVIYAVKPRVGSLGYGLLAKLCTGKKLVLDIDDWEMGFVKDTPRVRRIKNGMRFWDIDNTWYTWIMDACVRFADAITVSNTFLQKKYGGICIPHFRDTTTFDPAQFDRTAIRTNLGVPDKKVIMFFGTIREHKGVRILIDALDRLDRKDCVLLLVGADTHAQSLLPKRTYLRVYGRQPFEKVPEFLAAADIVALMQDPTSQIAKGQLPAKIFDAMAMAKPIVSTAISDIPAILEGCGVIVENNGDSLAQALAELLDNPEKMERMGARAREKCVAAYSYSAVTPMLVSLFEKILRKGPTT